jgi:hypothetical protein
MPSKYRPYYPRVANRPQQQADYASAFSSGQTMGKDFGGAISQLMQQAKMDKIANQLMDEQSVSDQPGAGQTISLGKLGGDGSGGGGDGSTQDLGPLPADTSTFTNPATGNVEPLQGQGSTDDDFAKAIAAARLQGSPNAPTVGSDQGPQSAATGSQGDFTLPSTSGPIQGADDSGTVGSLVHTGGTQEMELRKAMLAQQLQKAQLAKATAPAPPPDPLDVATRRAKLAKTLAGITQSTSPKAEKNPPAVNIGSEPVIDQNQLNRHIDGIYGNNAASSMASSINEPQTLPDGTPNPKAPVVSGDSVSVPVGANKNITMPLAEAQTYVKQANALRIKQGLPAYRVPGEDQTVGATAANPYIAHNNLDVYSRAPGTWIRLPNGKVAQVPPR